MSKAVFIDRDGVINVDYGYVYKIEQFDFIPRVIPALKKLTETDFKIIIITSQTGIGEGYYKEEDYKKLTAYMLKEFEKNSIRIDANYHCPHPIEEKCSCRKPEIELLERAKEDFNVSFKDSYLIGDKTSDVLCGKNAGCKTILVRTGDAGKNGRYEINPDFTAADLKEGIDWILSQEK